MIEDVPGDVRPRARVWQVSTLHREFVEGGDAGEPYCSSVGCGTMESVPQRTDPINRSGSIDSIWFLGRLTHLGRSHCTESV